MLLEKARLLNVCQHKDLQADFGPGITAIVGQNGSGKSNLADMIRVCVTNDFSSVRGTKDMNIRRGIRPDEMSYIQTWWTTRNGYVSIRRGLQNVPSAIFVNNKEDRSITGKEQAITKRALDLLGVSAGTINNFMFADFRTLRQIVEGTKTARMEMFTSLCGIEHIQRMDRLVQKQISADNAVIAEVTSEKELEDLRVRWQLLKPRIKGLRVAAAELVSQKVPDETVANWRAVSFARTSAATKLQKLKAENNELVKTVEQATAAQHEAKVAVARQQQEIATFEQSTVLPAKEACAAIAKKRETLQARLKQYNAYTAAAATMAKQAPLQPVAEGIPPLEDCLSQQIKAADNLAAAKAHREELGEGGQRVCKECGTLLGEVTDDQVAAAEQKVKKLQAVLDAANALTAEATRHKEKMWQHQLAYLSWEKDRTAAQAFLDSVKDVAGIGQEPEPIDEEEFNRLTKQSAEAATKLTRMRDELTSMEKMLRNAEESSTVAQTNLARTKREYDEIVDKWGSSPADGVAELDGKLAEQEALRQKLADATTALKVEETRAGELLPQLRAELRKRRRVSRLTKFVDVATRFRNMASRDRLQARAIGKTLRKTTHYVNSFLQQFSMPFKVSIDPEEFEFVVHHRDGTQEVAARLSVGQGLALGISFWLARTTAFHGELPLFVLDEPTANLDAERVVSVASLFSKLSDELQAVGRQGIVITHHTAVAEAATRKVTLL